MPERYPNARERLQRSFDDRRDMTIADVAMRGGKIMLCCWRCHREVERDAGDLVERHAATIVTHLPTRCLQCGPYGLPYTKIRWPSRGGSPCPNRSACDISHRFVCGGRGFRLGSRGGGGSSLNARVAT